MEDFTAKAMSPLPLICGARPCRPASASALCPPCSTTRSCGRRLRRYPEELICLSTSSDPHGWPQALPCLAQAAATFFVACSMVGAFSPACFNRKPRSAGPMIRPSMPGRSWPGKSSAPENVPGDFGVEDQPSYPPQHSGLSCASSRILSGDCPRCKRGPVGRASVSRCLNLPCESWP